jgi:predicted  nucleic acid-binding Zn-ribbon protein
MVFSLSMIDMLCCGLGAVIFLMILYSWDARRQLRALSATRQRLEHLHHHLGEAERTLQTTQEELRATRLALERSEETVRGQSSELAALTALLKEARRLTARKEEELSVLQSELSFVTLALARREGEVESLRKDLATRTDELRREADRRAAAERKLSDALSLAEQVPLLRQRVKELETEIATGKRQIKEMQERLALEEKRRTAAEEQLAMLPRLRDQLAETLRKTSDLEATRSQLLKEKEQGTLRLTELQRVLETVQQENATLRQQVKQEQSTTGTLRKQLADADARFAGIDLSGKRVVLLVDKSGSMDYSEGNKPDPAKWPTVCRTVSQVLGSLRDVERFQVILFSDQVTYPLGRPDAWHEFDAERSPQQVQQALANVRPGGDTNLYLGFEAAFRFKAMGMDAIYLFSDGLPNVGPGLPNPPPKDEAALTAALGRHLRDAIRRGWNARAPQVRIHAIGFYYDSPALGAFLWSLTRENGGSFVGLH